MTIAESPVRFACGGIELAGRIFAPAGAGRACVVCHPHPLYGGDMDSSVITAITRMLAAAGVATLRFNFRGVGASGGRHDGGAGEIQDVAAAVDALAARTGLGRIVLVGYSFGALVALKLAQTDARIAGVAAVAPPFAMTGLDGIGPITAPLLVVCGDRDTYCPAADAEAFTAGRTVARAMRLAGADHFFAGREHEVANAVADFVRAV